MSRSLHSHRKAHRLSRLIHDQAGFSLVEELVALSLIALGLVLLVAMLSTGSFGVSTLGNKTTAGSLARNQLELIKAANYEPDPTANPYPAVPVSAPYSMSLTIEYWDATNDVFVSAVRNDGLQRVTVAISRAGKELVRMQDLKVDR